MRRRALQRRVGQLEARLGLLEVHLLETREHLLETRERLIETREEIILTRTMAEAAILDPHHTTDTVVFENADPEQLRSRLRQP